MRTRISRYRILKQLYSGATAELLLGSYGADGETRYAALKQIRSEHARDQRYLQRFLGEVRLTIALGHKHLVEVHDVLGADGDYVVAMEYVHGADLRTLLASAAQRGFYMPVEYVCAIGSAVAAGLHHAHELRDDNRRSLGVVHRNVSPSNILLGYDGSIKLSDFGTSKAAMQYGDADAAIAGRVSYLSPEQCQNAELDRRSDVYSLGVVLYELATTSRLFAGDSDEDVIAQIVRGEVAPPQSLRPDLPGELSAIILRAIAVDPADRYANAGELRAALDHLAGRGKRVAASSLAAYVRKQVGERPEPWRDDASVVTPAFLTGNTWIEPARSEFGDEEVSRMMARPSYAVSTVATTTGELPAIALPSMSMPRFASSPPIPIAPRGGAAGKAAMVGVPLLALAGLAIWRLALAGHPAAPMVPPISASAPAPALAAIQQTAQASPGAAATVAPAAAIDAGTTHDAGSADPSTQHLARSSEPTGRTSKPHTTTPSSSTKISTSKSVEPAPVAAPAHPAPVVAAPPAPAAAPVPVVVTTPVVAAVPVPVAPPPAAAPAPVAAPQVISPQALDANRIAGDKNISVDGTSLLEIKQAHKDKITAAFKLCVDTEGVVSSITTLQSTSIATFDAKIENTIRNTWRYRPFLVNGRPSPVCTKFGFVYFPPAH